ncbi:MAG: hypothetical protein H6546_00765 [Chitinophagales bacterium]|nr:hypothetical protein [Flavobacteriaceae bacterium]MCB0538484.1 hypothetical protein [Bacteroidota bacterium]MCB9018842.1 hypothetical protein [Chitinophagales bacterium]
MKKLIVFLLPLLLSGCFIGKQVMEGTYQFKGVYGVAYEMELHSNGTFTYNWQNGLNIGTTTGTWEKEDGFLVLNGGTKPPEQKILVQEGSKLDQDSIYIEMTNFEGDPLALANVVLNDDQVIVADVQGKAVTGKSTIRKIKVNYLTFDIPEYQVKNPSANHFAIKTYTELNPDVYFENTKVQIKGNKLIVPGNLLTEETPITLKRLK